MLAEFLATQGYTIERVVANAPPRGIAIARDGSGRRLLATVIPEHADAAAIAAEVRETNLPLWFAGSATFSSGDPCFFVAEELPLGISSTDREWAEQPAALFRRWGLALAAEIQRLELRALVLHCLRPELVFVSTTPPYVHGIAERCDRLAGLRPRAGTCTDDTGAVFHSVYHPLSSGPTVTDHVFFLAAAIWRWKHSRSPFPASFEGLSALRAGVAVAPPGSDALDRLLTECFHPRGTMRPGIDLVTAALRAG